MSTLVLLGQIKDYSWHKHGVHIKLREKIRVTSRVDPHVIDRETLCIILKLLKCFDVLLLIGFFIVQLKKHVLI